MNLSSAPAAGGFGATLQPAGGVVFRLWAPSVADASVAIESGSGSGRHAMKRDAAGWHEASVATAGAGSRYRFIVGPDSTVPDPASRCNPDDVNGASEVVDPRRFAWRDAGWRGRPWHEAIVYELHVGAFTPEGTFAAAADRLADLASLGITAVQLMPVADFAGTRGWGYDGVLPFAPDASYGTPDDLRSLVDRAHATRLMVLLDVVYNHFGPDGNYLHAFCSEFFNPDHVTPWGPAINFDGEYNGPVRRFFVENALHWIETFHIDGLRLDAVHQIRDDSPTHIVDEIAEAIRRGPGRERHVHLVLENDLNEAHRLARSGDGRPLQATAQWNDDFHHAAHVLLTGETDAYYADFADAPDALFGRALAEGYVYQGQASAHREMPVGEPSAHLPSIAFVSFLQNHDQTGNRALGERIEALADPARLEAALACLLLSPHVPMLFMGEEFAASTPFLYFCDFAGELGQAVSKGRRAEFGGFEAFADEAGRSEVPDPNAVSTFMRSKLRWHERSEPPYRARLAFVSELLALRQRHLIPRLEGQRSGGTSTVEGGLLRVEWVLGDRSRWQLLANFSSEVVRVGSSPAGDVIYSRGMTRLDEGDVEALPASVRIVCVM